MTDLFDATDAAPTPTEGLVGIAVILPDTCPRCDGRSATTGASRGPHNPALLCACGRHRGWMSATAFNFIADSVRRFGRPTKPILVTRNRAAAECLPLSPET
jgi:hypothetical protein